MRRGSQSKIQQSGNSDKNNQLKLRLAPLLDNSAQEGKPMKGLKSLKNSISVVQRKPMPASSQQFVNGTNFIKRQKNTLKNIFNET